MRDIAELDHETLVPADRIVLLTDPRGDVDYVAGKVRSVWTAMPPTSPNAVASPKPPRGFVVDRLEIRREVMGGDEMSPATNVWIEREVVVDRAESRAVMCRIQELIQSP